MTAAGTVFTSPAGVVLWLGTRDEGVDGVTGWWRSSWQLEVDGLTWGGRGPVTLALNAAEVGDARILFRGQNAIADDLHALSLAAARHVATPHALRELLDGWQTAAPAASVLSLRARAGAFHHDPEGVAPSGR